MLTEEDYIPSNKKYQKEYVDYDENEIGSSITVDDEKEIKDGQNSLG